MKRLFFLFAFVISMAFTVQANETSNDFKPVDIVSTFEVPMIMTLNFEVPTMDVFHLNFKNQLNYENIETSINSNVPDVDNYNNDYFLQNYQANIYKQIDYNNKGFNYLSSQNHRYIGSITQSRYIKAKGNNRQIDRRSNYQKIKICKTNYQTSWQYHTSRMYNRRAERIDRIATRDHKPLQRNKYPKGRHYNYSQTIYTKNDKSVSLDWWRNITAYSNWSYPKIC